MAKLIEEARKKRIADMIREAERKARLERMQAFGETISPYDIRLVSELFGLIPGED